MIEKGVVSDIKEEKLIVNIKRHAACKSCRACSMAEDKTMRVELYNNIGASIGDSINIELDDSIVLKGAALFYGAPLLGLILGIFAGRPFNELVSAVTGIVFMAAAFSLIRKISIKNKENFKPKISKT